MPQYDIWSDFSLETKYCLHYSDCLKQGLMPLSRNDFYMRFHENNYDQLIIDIIDEEEFKKLNLDIAFKDWQIMKREGLRPAKSSNITIEQELLRPSQKNQT